MDAYGFGLKEYARNGEQREIGMRSLIDGLPNIFIQRKIYN